jgi:two-component system sensor histidine kinase KdpD
LFAGLVISGEPLGVFRVVTNPDLFVAGQPAGRLLEAFAQVAALAIHHGRLVRQATTALALEESDVLKTALLGAVSHELRTPLGSIKASVTGLLEPGQQWNDSARAELLSAIDEETDRLTSLVENLLDLSRIEGGALRPRLEWYDVHEFIETVLARLEPLFPTHALALGLEEQPWEARFDYVLLGQVVRNLVENAVKFSSAGSSVSISVGHQGSNWEIRVADEGRGIPASERERVFDRFYRGLGSAGVPGSGLGLTISRGIVQAHGGSIAISDVPGGGSVFIVSLPSPEQALANAVNGRHAAVAAGG